MSRLWAGLVVTAIVAISSGTLSTVRAPQVKAAVCVGDERGTATEVIVRFVVVGTCQWSVPTGVTSVRALVVGGGGGGGSDNGGGGGAGGFIDQSNVVVTPGTSMNVIVGGGGNGALSNLFTASNGGDSRFSTLIARGGGGGGSIDNTPGADGGSAGGRAANRYGNAENATVTSSPTQGSDGGAKSSGGFGGGGGGGAGGAGSPGGSNVGGNGGVGRSSDILGHCGCGQYPEVSVFAGGGGGGGDSNTAGTGGSGSGGDGSQRGDQVPTQGVDGTGGGGGAAGGSVAGGLGARGGSGVVVLRYARTSSVNGVLYEGHQATFTAPTGRTFTGVAYASYGTPGGSFGNYTNGACHESNSADILANLVVGQTSVTISSDNGSFGDPCGGVYKWLAFSLILSTPPTTTTTSTTTTTTTTIPPTTTTIRTTTTTTIKADVTIDIQAPLSPSLTVPQGQASVATIAPGTVAVSTSNPATSSTVAAAATPSTSVAPLKRANGKAPAPTIPEVATGESALEVGGVPTKVAVTRENNQLVIRSGSLEAVLSGLDDKGSTRALDSEGNLHLAGGDVVKINIGGFKPGSAVEVWLFSTPINLGSAVVGSDGRVSGTFTIPTTIEDGAHRIAVTAKLPNGKDATFTLGVAIGDIKKSSTLTRVLIAIPISIAVGFGFVLPNRLRRRRKLA